MSKVFFLMLSLLIYGCTKTLNYQVKKFIGKTIVLDKAMLKEIPGKQENINTITDSLCKIIIYIDSTECSACKISNLNKYNDIYYSALKTKRYIPIMIFSPSSKKVFEVINLLKYSDFHHSIYIDSHHHFSNNNSIPIDKRLHTFLVNKDNKVILLGDPTNNVALWNLYVKTINELYVPEN